MKELDTSLTHCSKMCFEWPDFNQTVFDHMKVQVKPKCTQNMLRMDCDVISQASSGGGNKGKLMQLLFQSVILGLQSTIIGPVHNAASGGFRSSLSDRAIGSHIIPGVKVIRLQHFLIWSGYEMHFNAKCKGGRRSACSSLYRCFLSANFSFEHWNKLHGTESPVPPGEMETYWNRT